MSVLYKALQKAAKENEQRQAEAPSPDGLDAGRLAGSGAIRMAGGRGLNLNWRVAGASAAIVLALAIAAAFFLFEPAAPPPQQVAAAPPQQPQPLAPAAPAQAPAAETAAPPAPAEAAPAPMTQDPAPAAESMPPAETAAAAAAAVAEAEAMPAEQPVAAVDQTAPEPAQQPEAMPTPLTPPAPPAQAAAAPAPSAPRAAREPMPQIAADSPARMLNPPISIQRAEFELSGVGDMVRVREVAQAAQDNVGAGYNALISGSYDTALGFYDRALQQEPTSVLALLGRGAALHKLGRYEEAGASYRRVLQIDPQNREALTNLTAITGERSPGEALTRLMELEREYPGFSPIKAQIGLAYAKMGTLPEAANYLQRAIALTPDAVTYHYNLALVLDRMGRAQQAVVAYERVLAAVSAGRGTPDLPQTEIERRVRFLRAQ